MATITAPQETSPRAARRINAASDSNWASSRSNPSPALLVKISDEFPAEVHPRRTAPGGWIAGRAPVRHQKLNRTATVTA